MLENKLKKIVLMVMMVFCVIPSIVFGETFSSESSCYNYNHTTGAYGGSGCSDHLKKSSSGKTAFCSEFSRPFNGKCSVDATWKSNGKYAVMTGYIIRTVYHNDDYSDYSTIKKYGVTSLSINAYLANNYPKSWGKYSRGSGRLSNDGDYTKNKVIKGILDKAEKEYNDLKITDTKLPNVSFQLASSILQTSGNQYISRAISTKGMVATYGKADTTYTISGTVPNGTVQICLRADGTNCVNKYELKKSGDVSFYLKAIPNAGSNISNQTVTVSISGSNKSSYYTSIRYNCGSAKQHLIVEDKGDVSRSVRASAQLKIPTPPPEPNYVQHQVSAIKIDDTGAQLGGATLELWQDNPENGGKLLTSNNGQGSEIRWVFAKVEVGKSDPAFDHDYYLLEKSAPDGFVINRVRQIEKEAFQGGNVSKCYNTGDSDSTEAVEEKDMNFCEPANFKYRCQSSLDPTKFQDLAEGGGCNFEPPTTEGGDTGAENPGNNPNPLNDTTDETGGTGESGEGGEIGGTPPDPEPVETWNKVCWDISKDQRATKNNTNFDGYCESLGNYVKVVSTGGNVFITHTNIKNTVVISKQAATGDDEVAGASLKICTKESYDAKKNDCEVAKNIDNVELSWVSGNQPHEWQGLKKGEYYIVETVPPAGYVLATTAVPFSIDEEGNVKSGKTVITNEELVKNEKAIVVKNTLTSVSVSKTDIATSKELPGATISICSTYKDENGEFKMYMESDSGLENEDQSNDCIPAVLANGSSATWVSTDKPYKIIGLPAGTYYLVEKSAPSGYSTAEAVLFSLREDGKLVDKNGKLLSDNKLVMHDKKIEEVKTGMLPFYIVMGIFVFVIGCSGISYYYLNKENGKNLNKGYKVRKRKIHK